MRKLTNRALFICFALMTSFCLIAPATALRSYAQEGGGSTLEGLIKDDSGPLLGATVIVKNTTRGTTTDMDGKFRLEGLQPGDVLQVTYVGYDPYEVTYTGQTTLDILMTTTANQLNAVVVTAMGIERQSKTLSYAAETVGGDDVADIKSVNMINALQGKAAGLQITPNSTGAGGSSKILFRGNKSINGSNQPLVVVDGVPLMMNITSDQVDSNWGAQRDGGDAMSTINPDDIASISLLKGASAAALYGAVDGNSLTGLWFDGQKYFAATLPAAHEEKQLPVFDQTRKWLDSYFSGENPGFTPPLHPEGSSFRQAVWEILLQIPYGETITYKDIAKEIARQQGKQTMSAQAIGGAVGHNPISIIIPCHRVVGSDGSLTGYAGGIPKKVGLLTLEQANMSGLFIPKR